MSTAEHPVKIAIRPVPERGMRMLEHPERPGEAWCGAPVLGVRGRFGPLDCVVCADLEAARRRRP